MTTIVIPTRSRRRRGDTHRDLGSAVRSEGAASTALDPPLNPNHHGGRVVFEVRFTSSMGGSAMELLRRRLAMTTHVDHKLPVDPNSPAHARLDRESSLLLERGPAADQWVLQARAWGRPSARTVHAWHVRVAEAAHLLDATVPLPERMPPEPYAVPMRPVGHSANTRWAAARRRLVGLP